MEMIQFKNFADLRDWMQEHIDKMDGDGSMIGPVTVINGLERSEPGFFLRAKDNVALPIIGLYREATYAMVGEDKLDSMLRAIQRIVDWRRGHIELCKDPD